MDFACDDLKGDSLRDTINALGNIKRSIDCLFDSLPFAVNFSEDSKRGRWTFPEKMNFLGEIGIITPDILSKINSMRNLLEHEFKKPDRKEVEPQLGQHRGKQSSGNPSNWFSIEILFGLHTTVIFLSFSSIVTTLPLTL